MNAQNDPLDFEELDTAEADAYADLDLEGDDENLTDFGSDESTSDSGDTAETTAKNEAEKKKRKMLFNALVAAVVLVGGGFAVYSFLGNSAPDAMPAPVASPTVPQPDTQVAIQAETTGQAPAQPSVDALIGGDQPQAAPVAAQQDVGLFENPEIATQTQPEMAAPTQQPVAAADVAAVPAAPSGQDPFAALEAAPVAQPAPAVETGMTATTDPFAALTAPATPAENAPVAAAPETTDVPAIAAVEATNTSVADQPVAPVENSAEPKTSAVPVPAEYEALQERVSALESKFDGVNSQLTSVNEKLDTLLSSSSTKAIAPGQIVYEEPKAEEDTPVVEKPKAKKAKKAVKKQVSATSYNDAYKPVQKAPAPVKESNHVELRGISGSSALVSVNGALRQVRVGETVPGLGKVTDISRGSAGWVVQGTKGSATQ